MSKTQSLTLKEIMRNRSRAAKFGGGSASLKDKYVR